MFEELSKLELEVSKLKEEYERAIQGKQYYLLESSPVEEKYWSRAFRALRDRVNVVINEWELDLVRFYAGQEDLGQQDE